MEARCVVVDLHFVEHVDVGFAGEFGGGHFVEGFALVVAGFGVEDVHMAVDAAEFQQMAQGFVVSLPAVVGVSVHQLQLGAADDFHRGFNQRRHNLLVGGLLAHGFGRDVVDVRDAVVGNGNLVGR